MPARNPNSNFSLDDDSTGKPEAPRKKRLGVLVPLTETGALDVDRVRSPQEIERARAALGVVDPATLPPVEPPKINKEFILPAYSLLEVVIQFLGKKALKWPDALAEEMHFSEEKKEALVEPTAAVLARFSPAWLVANQDIAALAAAFASAVDDMVTQGAKRYIAKVQAGQVPPPPGIVEVAPKTDGAPREFRPIVQTIPGNGATVAA